jgi:archaellum component FlaC
MNNPFKNFNAKINGQRVKTQKEFIDKLQEEINKVSYIPKEAISDVVEEETICEPIDMSNIDGIKEGIEQINDELTRIDAKIDEMKITAETLRSEHNAVLAEILKLQTNKEILLNDKIEAIQELHEAVTENLSKLNERLEREETIIDSLTDEDIEKLHETVDSLMNIFTSLTKTGTN